MKEMIQDLINKVTCNGNSGRMGKVFKTTENYYFLDSGTGKVARVTEPVYLILKVLLENPEIENIYQLGLDEKSLQKAIVDINEGIEKEHILSAIPVTSLTGAAVTRLNEILADEIENVTLEVTQKCNLRCKYCIYHPSHPEHREFGQCDMEWKTAKKAIDFLKEHSKNAIHRHIGFYGGEPFLNFALIQQCVSYANEIFNNNIEFALTTNATLVNDEMAEYLAQNAFDIIISLDGPEHIHNENRVMADGRGSFKNTIAGAKKLFNAYRKYNQNGKLSFNMVVTGKYCEEKYNEIQDFLDGEDWIPKDTLILTSGVDMGPRESQYYMPQSEKDCEYMENSFEPLVEWEKSFKKQRNKQADPSLVAASIDKGLLIIHKRVLSDEPVKAYGMNGCCVPGQRRIFVSVDGIFYHCEKVGNIPPIGNVESGFYIEDIQKIYIDDFIKEACKYCKDCWAINLCTLCYVECYDSKGTHFSYRHNACRSERKYLENNLIRYHSVAEKNPEFLQQLNERTLD